MARYAYAEREDQVYENNTHASNAFSYRKQQRISIKSNVTTADVRPIAELIIDNELVILDLNHAENALRIIDTLAGVAYGNNSTVTPISKNLYLIAPGQVNVSVQGR